MLFSWTDRIPFVSDPAYLGSFFYMGPFFNLLPIVWVVLMLWQQKLMTPPPADEQQAMQQKMMKYMMIPFFFFFYKVPAGLCIYWIGSICWSLGERKFLPKRPAAGTTQANVDTRKRAETAAVARSKPRSDKDEKTNGNGTMSKVSEWWAEVLKQARKK
jgi:membrane protein insertase Oxa1/YidC/SpoIIIJ